MGLSVIAGGAGASVLPTLPEGCRPRPALRVVEGAVCGATGEASSGLLPDASLVPSLSDLHAEMARRLAPLNIARWDARLKATGLPVPRHIDRKRREIEFVAQALGRLATIPADYRNDLYWPALLP